VRVSEDGGRVFLRGISSEQYGLGEHRRAQLAAPRVRRAGSVTDDAKVGHSGDSDEGQSKTWWMLGPGDEPFLTQTLHVHFVELKPGGSNHGHGHQNEATFYILEGKGYEIHDGVRYDWEEGDFAIVHTEAVHRHYNASTTERALALVIKAKAEWMFLGLIQQGRSRPFDRPGFGTRQEWSKLWSPDAPKRKKIVKRADTTWVDTRDGHVRVISSPERTDVRSYAVDLYEQEIQPGGASGKHWHMADEVCYVISGKGHSLQWEVDAEIAEKYYARIADEPSRHDFTPGDVLYVPQNTVHQHFADGDEPLRLLVAQNRLFKQLGYDSVVHLEDARTGKAEKSKAAAAAE
jgi:quercetin dioxygenase-like cupin family protein